MNAPSGFLSNVGNPNGQPVPNWNTALATQDNASSTGFGWAYDTRLLATSFPGYQGPTSYNWSIQEFVHPTSILRFTVSYRGYIVTMASLYSSIDGVNWTHVYDMPGTSNQVEVNVDHTFAVAVCAKYLSIVVKDNGGGSPANAQWNVGYYGTDGVRVYADRAGTPIGPETGSFSASVLNDYVAPPCKPSTTLVWSCSGLTDILATYGPNNEYEIPLSITGGTLDLSPVSTTTYTVHGYIGCYEVLPSVALKVTVFNDVVSTLYSELVCDISGKLGVEVKWASAPDAAGYYVYRKDPGGSYALIGEAGQSTSPLFVDWSVITTHEYFYKVVTYWYDADHVTEITGCDSNEIFVTVFSYTVPQGGENHFPPTGFEGPAKLDDKYDTWEVWHRGSLIATSDQPNGWGASYQFEEVYVSAPIDAPVDVGYELKYNDAP